MAQLSSPGVSVTVIDESFYTPAAAGTVPLIVVASAENKQNGAATGTAPGTLKANAGKVYLLTSQKDLSDTFGIPKFYTDANNNIPISKVVDIIRGSELYTATSFIEKSERKTDWWDKNSDCSSVSTEFSMIDHILMTPYLYNHIKDVSIYTYPEYCGTYNSDHFPVIVDFDFYVSG